MSTITLKKVRSVDESGADAITISLFKDDANHICGWFIGPVTITSSGIDMPYLPRSERTIASVAVVRAIETADAAGLPLHVVDPDDLWSFAWRS